MKTEIEALEAPCYVKVTQSQMSHINRQQAPLLNASCL